MDRIFVNQRTEQLSNSSSLSGRLVYTEPLGNGFYASANYSYSWSKNTSTKDAYDSGSNVIGDKSLIYDPRGEARNETYSSNILNRNDNQSAGLDLQYQKDKIHAQLGFSVMPNKIYNETHKDPKDRYHRVLGQAVYLDAETVCYVHGKEEA